MASQTAGIQQLLVAEKRAAEKINEARKRKNKRLKQAKEEAQQEIERYRQDRESQFKEFERLHLGTREDVQNKIDSRTQQDLKDMEGMVHKNKEQVIQRILELICDIKPELHRNYKG